MHFEEVSIINKWIKRTKKMEKEMLSHFLSIFSGWLCSENQGNDMFGLFREGKTIAYEKSSPLVTKFLLYLLHLITFINNA